MKVDARGFLHSLQKAHTDHAVATDEVGSTLPSRAVMESENIYGVSCDNGHTAHRIVNATAMLQVGRTCSVSLSRT